MTLPTRQLRERPDLAQLKRQAKELLEAFLSSEKSTVAEVNRFYPDCDAAEFALHDAQLVLARSYGYDSWPKLRAHVDGVTVKYLMRQCAQATLRLCAQFLRFARSSSTRQRRGTTSIQRYTMRCLAVCRR